MSTTTDARPVGSYVRISKRRGGDGAGASLGMERQHSDNLTYAQSVFGPDVEVVEYGDNMSAWDPDVYRPDWERLLEDLAAGRLRAVIGWHSDRLTRQPLQLEHLFTACKRGRAQLHTARGGHATDVTMLRIQGALAAAESDQKSARQLAKQRQLAGQGKPHGGRRRFGYEPGMVAIREDEAEVIRDAVARVLAGESLHSITRRLIADEVATAEGGTWTAANLGTMLKRPHLAGLRVYKGEVTGRATWPAIIDEATHHALTVLLNNPSRRTSYTNATRHLVAGLARCGTCGAHVRGRPNFKRDGRSYACTTGRHVSKPAAEVEAVVGDWIVTRLEVLTESGILADGSAEQAATEVRDALAALAIRRDETAEDYAAGAISREARNAANASLDREETRLKGALVEAQAALTRPEAVLAGMTGPGAREAWERADISRKRAIVDLLATVTLHSTGKGRKPFDPECVAVVFR